MISLLTALHTKQVWLGILALSVWIVLYATRPVPAQPIFDPSTNGYSDRVQSNRTSDLNYGMQKLIQSGFYTPSPDAGSARAQLAAAEENKAVALPKLGTTRSVNGKWAAYFGSGADRIVVEENDAIYGWIVSDIGPSSIQLTNETESRRLYLFERLPDANSEDSQL